jgi:NitT/TauT family transport system permease protein
MKPRAFDYVLLVISIVVLWQFAFYWAGPEAISPPLQTVQKLSSMMAGERFWDHAAATGVAFAYALLIALGGGLVTGLLLGTNRVASAIFSPILSTLYSIPKIMLYPVILLIFGLGLSAKVAFGALHGFFPVALFAMGAIANIRPALLRTARVMRLSPLTTARTVLLPAALPEIVTGLRVGFSTTLLGTLIGELFASNQGLGFMLIRAMDANNVPETMALTMLLFVVATAANVLIMVLERRVHAHA